MASHNIPSSFANRIIPVEKAQEMYDAYTTRRVNPINQFEATQNRPTPFDATRLAQLDFEQLKAYVDFISSIDTKLKAQGKPGVKSFRIYFAHYPLSGRFSDNTHVMSVGHDSYAGKNTIMMTPTTEINGREQAFMYILNNNDTIEVTPLDPDPASKYNSLILNEIFLKPPPHEQSDF